MKNNLYIGVMTGTSLDGVDIALCSIDNKSIQLVHALEYPFDLDLKKDILNAINNKSSLEQIGKIDTQLGHLFADSILLFMEKYTIDHKNIQAIGLHGQTLWHAPNGKYPFSMQLANAHIVCLKTKIKTISDFRQKDVALGGQGSPLTPAFHEFLFTSIKQKTAILNIGGMANITLLEKPLIGFDTGCGNVLLDFWIHKHQNKLYDKSGLWAKGGTINQVLLTHFLNESYFHQDTPKSTGRELFNEQWLNEKLKNFFDVSAQDVMATLTALSAKSIALSLKDKSLELLLVCGGGVHNTFLLQCLENELPNVDIKSTQKYDISPDHLEAMAFAWLGYKRLNKQTVNLKSVTGAKENTLLGVIYE